MNIVSAVILCTIVGAIGAVVLVLAAKFMAVEEDPRIEEVSACLAGANCGGCGYAGCADYAKAVVMDGVPCDKCAPGGPKAAAAIAKIMGGEASAVEKKAVVQCQGNSEHCKPSYEYKGIQTCAAAATLYGGPKTCTFACIGLGDCTKVCKFDAIHIVDGVAKVDKDKCTGCGACANICPKHVIMIDAGGPASPWSCAPIRIRVLWQTSCAPPPALPAACASAPVSSMPSTLWTAWPVWTTTSARAAACAPRSAPSTSSSSR